MRTRFATLLLLAAVLLAGAVAAAAAPTPRGVGFELRHTSISPKHPTFDGKRKIRLHYGFSAKRPVDLRIEVRRAHGDKVVRTYREREARPGRRLVRVWNGLSRRGRAADGGRYEFRVGPAGGAMRFAGRFRLRTHVFPVAGPHGSRGAIGEFGAPRSGGRVHEGFDITADCGTRLRAARGGEVKRVGYDPVLYGYYALINGRKTRQSYFYSHLIAPPPVARRERVRTGEHVGRVGRTGNAATTPCHLHFEVRIDGRPVDPAPYLRDWDG
ncbi:MAG TPA: M23 family metallopeptidase [Solirubrobacterales bacterium]|nr:M23 family metallopeptidase [Solirubrobacterales bacterium]